jgi:hypothetical protein
MPKQIQADFLFPARHAEKLLEAIGEKVREKLGAGQLVIDHLIAALNAAIADGTGACKIDGICYNGYSSTSCGVAGGDYGGNGSVCAITEVRPKYPKPKRKEMAKTAP